MGAFTRLTALLLAAVCALPASRLGAQGDDRLRAALAKRVDETKQGTGVVVGLLTPEGRSFTAHAEARGDCLDQRTR